MKIKRTMVLKQILNDEHVAIKVRMEKKGNYSEEQEAEYAFRVVKKKNYLDHPIGCKLLPSQVDNLITVQGVQVTIKQS